MTRACAPLFMLLCTLFYPALFASSVRADDAVLFAESLPSSVYRDCDFSPSGRPGFTASMRVDNDLFGGRGQDQGYSNGVQLSLVSPNLVDYHNDPCLPRQARRLNRYLDWLYSGSFGDERNMMFSLQHVIFTPQSRTATQVVENDRPFVGALLLGSGYNARDGDRLRAGHFRIGLVGPAALGEQVQNEWHRLVDVDRSL